MSSSFDVRPLDLVFVACERDEANARHLEGLLAHRGGFENIVVVERGDRPRLRRALVERCGPRIGVTDDARWQDVLVPHGASPTRAINAGLITARNHCLVWDGNYGIPANLDLETLRTDLLDHDRVAIVAATALDLDASSSDVERAAADLPRVTETLSCDVPCLVVHREVLNIVGRLDEELLSPTVAWDDFILRARRFGFIAMRSHRVAVLASRRELDRSSMEWLAARHPQASELYRVSSFGPSESLLAHAVGSSVSRLRVALDVRYLPVGAINGTGVYAIELCRNLLEHHGSSIDVTLWVQNDAQRDALASLACDVVVGADPPRGQHVVHRPAQVFDPRDLVGLLRSTGHVVISFQDLIAYRVPTVFANATQYHAYQAVSHLALSAAQAVLAISEHNRADLIRDGGVTAERIETVYHGVDAGFFGSSGSTPNRSLLERIGVTGPFFLYVGSDYAHKNLRLLLDAYVAFRMGVGAVGPLPELVLVGHPSGTVGGAYRELEGAFPQGVRYVRSVDGDTLRALYQESRALLYPSCYEGFGLPILEAMAAGTPVICSRHTSVSEVGGDAAWYLPSTSVDELAHAMRTVALHPEESTHLIAAGRQRVRDFTWKRAAQKTFALYERTVREPDLGSLRMRNNVLRMLEAFELRA